MQEVDLSPVQGPAPPKRESTISISHTHRMAARRAVCARCTPGEGRQRPAVWGSSAALLDRLVAEHGLDEVLQASEQLDAGVYQVPSFLALLEELLITGALPYIEDQAHAGAPAPPSRLDLQETRRRVAQRIATYEAEGYPAPDELLAELKTIDEQLTSGELQ